MGKQSALVILSLVLATSSASIFSIFSQDPKTTHWTNLSGKYGLGWNSFKGLPLTAHEAASKGWGPLGDDNCTGSDLFYGRRFIYNDDPTVVLMYDVKGVVAGIQVGLRRAELEVEGNDYHYSTSPSFVLDTIKGEDFYFITTYFFNPDKICTEGRSEAKLQTEGTASGIFFQRGHRDSYLGLTEDEQSLQNTPFTPEKCLFGMGNHYFWNLTESMDCRDVQPTFILTKNGRVLGFGQVIIGDASGATYFGGYEHPPMMAVRAIVKHVPECLSSYQNRFKLTSLHVYFVEHPAFINCF